MTVYNELNKIAYIGSAEQTLYPIPFEYISTDDIKVSVYTSNNEFVEDWTYSTQYVIEGGNVKVLSGYNIDNTKKLLILRSVDLIQDNKYREGGDFPAKSTETSFDKLTMITQQLQETLDRCVKVEVLDIQTPEELLQTVYDKLDSATEIAGDAISAANQAQTAADNATAAVNSAEQTLVQTQAYVDSAKVEIDNTKNAAINTINSTVAQAKSDINTAVSTAESNISSIVSDAEGSITNIAVTEANKAIANAAQEATDMAKANVNSYVDGTVKPSLQTYVDQAQADANSAATSATAASNYASNASADAVNAAESAGLAANSAAAAATSKTNAKTSETNAKIWAEGTDAQVQALGGEKSAKGWAEASTNLNHTNITNCITEIPQDIKLELNNGTLTLKAGSKVYVPNGSGVFDVVNITTDRSITNTSNDTYMVFAKSGGSGIVFARLKTQTGSGTTTPTSSWWVYYNTSDNKVYRIENGVNVGQLSLPLAIVTVSSGAISSIDQVFNGFGYIGSTVFALPGVKGLIPNGRNADGSLKNIEFATSSVQTATFNNGNRVVVLKNNLFGGYIDSVYNEKENYVTNSSGLNQGVVQVGKVVVAGNNITSLTPKTAFHAVDYNDFKEALEAKDRQLNNPFFFGMHIWSDTAISNASWLISNGSYHSGATYASFYEWLLKIKNGTLTVDGVSVKAYGASDITDYDYVINTADTTFRLPVKVKLASGNAVAGNGMTLGLKNNTYTAGLTTPTSSNASLDWTASAYGVNAGSAIYGSGPAVGTIGITTDPTKSGIETSSQGLYLYFYVGETVQDANVIAASNALTDIANIGSRTHIIETYQNGTSWYRVYSDGWIEQGGEAAAGTNVTVTFPKAFKNTNYTVIATSIGTNGEIYAQCIQRASASQMIIYNLGINSSQAKSWYACGYIS